MRWMVFVCVLIAGPAGAQDVWTQQTGDDVLAALDDRFVMYKASKQWFYKSGKTLYDAGRPSWGNWRVQGDQYCSEWPPMGGWACYDIFVNEGATKVRFVDAAGFKTDGVYAPLER